LRLLKIRGGTFSVVTATLAANYFASGTWQQIRICPPGVKLVMAKPEFRGPSFYQRA
jgi:hypothetical protein